MPNDSAGQRDVTTPPTIFGQRNLKNSNSSPGDNVDTAARSVLPLQLFEQR